MKKKKDNQIFKRIKKGIILFVAVSLLSGCASDNEKVNVSTNGESTEVNEQTTREDNKSDDSYINKNSTNGSNENSVAIENESISSNDESTLIVTELPEYEGEPYVYINDNEPYFDENERNTTEVFEKYSNLDELGRCQVAYANVCVDLMPTEERGEIGSVKPTGWHTVKYDVMGSDLYLYNRCHLIGYQLAGENANEKNLITGTRYLNIEGMLPFENLVAEYVEDSNNHVLYRVTPMFEGNNLVASGVEMEAYSIEDGGSGICFNVYCFNVQPGIVIDYATGESSEDGNEIIQSNTYNGTSKSATEKTNDQDRSINTGNLDNSNAEDSSNEVNKTNEVNNSNDSDLSENINGENSVSIETYVVNTNTKKFHKSDCSSINSMSDKNKMEYTGNREELINEGYSPCQRCNP